jgi:hypothetical protein
MNGFEPEWQDSPLPIGASAPLPPMVTLQILGGRKDKIRPGDVLGALTGDVVAQPAGSTLTPPMRRGAAPGSGRRGKALTVA